MTTPASKSLSDVSLRSRVSLLHASDVNLPELSMNTARRKFSPWSATDLTSSKTEDDRDNAGIGLEASFNYTFENQTRVYVPGSVEDKKLLRVIDLHIFPFICFLYFLNTLDRSSISNARIGGMEKDLHLSSSDYSLAVLMFSVGYLLSEIPSNMILTRVRPSLFLPLIAFSWGLVVTLVSVVQTTSELVGIRFVLGFVESGFFPGVIFLLSSWYRKDELGKRIGFLYTIGILSGAFGGLISGGVISGLNEARGIRGWRWLFIIEGSLTMLASILAAFCLPDWPSNTKWLTPEQKALAGARIAADRPTSASIDVPLTNIEAIKAGVTDWRVYVFSFMYLMLHSATSISYFIPTITETLGYTGQTAEFMTAPFFICACASIIAVSLSADYFKDRVFHIAVPTALAGAMYACCMVFTDPNARYGLICIGFAANHGALPIVLAWLASEITYPDSKRSVAQAVVHTVGNAAGIYGTFLWSNPPKFITGFASSSAFGFSCSIATIIGYFLFKKFPFQNVGTQSSTFEIETTHDKSAFEMELKDL